jgi:hypothetical protein
MTRRTVMLNRIADTALSLSCTAMRLSPAEAELARMALASLATAVAASFAVRRPAGIAALD